MKKSFIERIFPHSPGSPGSLPQYRDDYSVSSPRPAASAPRIFLQDSSRASSSSDPHRNAPLSPSQHHAKLSSSLVRHDDPFLQVERASKDLERTFQSLLDAQSKGLSAGGIGSEEADELSSVGSPTPTPSVATTPLSSGPGARPKTVPIRQPKPKKITLRGARRALEKSMCEFAALKQHELSLIDQEVVARDNATKQASDLRDRRQLLENDIHRIKSAEEPVNLRTQVEGVEQEIQHLEATLLELRSKHRVLVNQLREVESSRDSELSSYTASLALNESQVKSFLKRPPVLQSLNAAQEPGMYALRPERRTLQMAQEQWSNEVEALARRKANVETEKSALEEGSKLWRDATQRIREFEKDLKTHTRDLAAQSQSQIHQSSLDNGASQSKTSTDLSMTVVLDKLSALISSLESDLQHAEANNWNLLICAIGAELAAFEQARDLLQETAGMRPANSGSMEEPAPQDERRPVDNELHDDEPSPDLLTGQLEDMLERNGTRSPGETSNHSLEDTLRDFSNPQDKGKQRTTDDPVGGLEHNATSESGHQWPRPFPQHGILESDVDARLSHVSAPSNIRPKPPDRRMTSESEDDEPGPEFLLSHS
ncbi:hypothetical protein A1O7_01803 [Cladophialophora yegresii CBS 114405]|uniref:Uncharacterized protein n=1 Tax=Cladophialophora yegresii CBS 114405 TaxID=1182544 RepID=W9WBH5_9EURO|nr:uncharacterized protein A1O7_01803 [Cladophialophora yegresii CBS 114405]EXJ65462.1 hypothetical protein A1O7_01803 [Cladophialophora yegresii CBS 114405]